MKKINIAIVDDHKLVTDTLPFCLLDSLDFEVVFTANSGKELINALEQQQINPDVILMDIRMPDLNGFQVTEAVLKILPDCKILFLSSYESESYVHQAYQSGGHGYVLKNGDLTQLMQAIKDVYTNEFYFNELFSPEKIKEAKKAIKNSKYNFSDSNFTKRELEYIQLLCQGKTDLEISNTLFIEVTTARTHRKNIMQKIGVKKSIDLVVYALNNDII